MNAKTFLVRWILCILLALGLPPRAAANSLYVYVDCPDLNTLTGHSFLQMAPMAGPQVGNPNLVYGFYPATLNVFGGPGRIRNDAGRAWDWRICYPVTVPQYNAAAAVINADIATPPPYNLITFNCVDWVNSVATAAGQALPPFANGWGISDPSTLWNSLNGLGVGGVFGGGTVGTNTAGNAANGGPVSAAPRDYTYEGLARAGTTQDGAAQIASEMGLEFRPQHLGQVFLGAGQALTMGVTNASAADALIAVEWGDGTPHEAHQASFFHTYPVPGLYPASLVVVNGGAVFYYEWMVVVGPGGPAELLINVPEVEPSSATSPEPDPSVPHPVLPDYIDEETGPLLLLQPPQGTNVNEGDAVLLSAIVSGPNAAYQWFRDGLPIPGATQNPFELEAALPSQSGLYVLRATNDFPSEVLTLPVFLNVVPDLMPPTVLHALDGPQSDLILVSFSKPVDPATAGDPTNYALDGGAMVLDATVTNRNQVLLVTTPRLPGANYLLTVFGVTDLAEVRNPINPNPTTVTLLEPAPPLIMQNPLNRTAPGGSVATFTVAVNSLAPVTYQWRRNGINLPGKIDATLNVYDAQVAKQGSYTVVVASYAGSVTSNPAQLLVVNGLPFFEPVADQTVEAGDDLVVPVLAEDFDRPAQTLTYSLLSGPPGASIDSTNGFLTWPTTEADAGVTGEFLVRVRDNGTPPRQSLVAFNTQVLPAVRPTLGIARNGANLVLSWNTLPGVTYVLECTPILPPAWSDVAGPIEGTGVPHTVTRAIGPERTAFYRIRRPKRKPCTANEVTKTLKYSRGNNDADQLKAQFAATGNKTYVYENASMEFTLKAKPACKCNADCECEGSIDLTVDVKITEKTKCVEGKADRWRLMDGVDAASATTTRNSTNTPAPDVTTQSEKITYTNANAITGVDKVYTASAKGTVPCGPGTYHRRFVFTTKQAGDMEAPGAAMRSLAAYLDVHVKVEPVDMCKIKITLTGEYLEYATWWPWLTQCGGAVKDAVKELAPITYMMPGPPPQNGMTWNIAKLIEECGMKVDDPFPKKAYVGDP